MEQTSLTDSPEHDGRGLASARGHPDSIVAGTGLGNDGYSTWIFTCVSMPRRGFGSRQELLTINGEQVIKTFSTAYIKSVRCLTGDERLADDEWFTVMLATEMLAGRGDWYPMEVDASGDSWGELDVYNGTEVRLRYTDIAAIGVRDSLNPVIGFKTMDGGLLSFQDSQHGNHLLKLARGAARLMADLSDRKVGVGRLDVRSGTISFDGAWSTRPIDEDAISACAIPVDTPDGVDPAVRPMFRVRRAN